MSNFFSGFIFSACVPTFFFISGFLFFYKVKNFDRNVYLQKLKSRFRTLFIPFVFWNMLSCALIYLSMRVPAVERLLHISNSVFPTSLYDFFMYPVEGQFWFIRDLLVLVVLSPIINWVIFHYKYAGISIIFLLWLFFYSWHNGEYYYISIINPLMFFSAGAWCAYYKGNLEWLATGLKIFLPIWIAGSLILLWLPDGIIQQWLWNLIVQINFLIGTAAILASAVYACRRWKLNGAGLLASSSFFVFAVHTHYVQKPIRIILCKIFQPDSDFDFCVVYILLIVLTLVISVMIYKVLSVVSPKILGIVTGGRVHVCSNYVNKL